MESQNCHASAATTLKRVARTQEQKLPARHELLRQFHQGTHVFLLLEGTVELSAFTYVPSRSLIDRETLTPLEQPMEEAVSMQSSLGSGGSLLCHGGVRSMAHAVSSAAAHINPAVKAFVGRNASKVPPASVLRSRSV